MGVFQSEGTHAGEFIIREANGDLSREPIVVKLGQVLVAGAVLGKSSLGEGTALAGTNTGNGVMGAITVGADAIVGEYTLTVKTASANAGGFEVKDPQGNVVGTGNVAVEFTGGGITFTLADGAVDFIVGDTFTITVAEGTNQYVEYDPINTDGSGKAVAILFDASDATDGNINAVAFVRSCTVNLSEIVWKTTMSQSDIDAGVVNLAKTNVICR